MPPSFRIAAATEDDAARIAAIHVAAMDANPLLHAQFPTPESLAALREFLRTYTIEQLPDHRSGVLVARDPDSAEIAAFARWDYPLSSENAPAKVETTDIQRIEGCRLEYLESYAAAATEAKKRCFGERLCYSK